MDYTLKISVLSCIPAILLAGLKVYAQEAYLNCPTHTLSSWPTSRYEKLKGVYWCAVSDFSHSDRCESYVVTPLSAMIFFAPFCVTALLIWENSKFRMRALFEAAEARKLKKSGCSGESKAQESNMSGWLCLAQHERIYAKEIIEVRRHKRLIKHLRERQLNGEGNESESENIHLDDDVHRHQSAELNLYSGNVQILPSYPEDSQGTSSSELTIKDQIINYVYLRDQLMDVLNMTCSEMEPLDVQLLIEECEDELASLRDLGVEMARLLQVREADGTTDEE